MLLPRLFSKREKYLRTLLICGDMRTIDAPGGFLFEWWSVFWDIFIARTNDKHSDAAACYLETQVSKARELQQQKSQQQHIQMQQILLHRQQQQQLHEQQLQQQRRNGSQLLNVSSSRIANSDPIIRQNPGGTANSMAAKMYEEKLKLPPQRDPSDDIKQRYSDNVSPLLDPNHASMLKSAAVGGQHPGQTLHGTPGGMSENFQQYHTWSPQFPISAQDMKSEMNPMINARAGGPSGPEGSLIGLPGSNQGGNSLTLKGWPLTGLDHLRPGLTPHQKPMIQSPQSLNPMQQQPQIIWQPQQNLASPSMDPETRRRMMQQLPNNQPKLPNSQSRLSSPSPQVSNQANQTDKLGAGSMTMDAATPSSFRGNDQASKGQMVRKRKQPVSSSGPPNNSGTANTAGPPPSSAPPTPLTHTSGDAMSMQNLPHNGGSSKPPLMFGSDTVGTLTSASNQAADVNRFDDDATLDDNVASFLSHEEGDARDAMSRNMDESKGPHNPTS